MIIIIFGGDLESDRIRAGDVMNLNLIRKEMKNFGLRSAIYDFTLRTINRFILFKVLKGMKITSVDSNCLKIDKKYRHMFLDKHLLREFAKNREYELSESFLEQALEKGDECYGILDGNILASYGWYSNKPTNIYPEELVLHFSDEYIYMYKGFTHVDYRGQRLHAIGMSWALKEYLERGFKGVVSYVESNNFSSLKSVYRMGYEDFGKIYFIQILNKYLIFCDEGCKDYKFQLERAKPVLPTGDSSRAKAPALGVRS